MLFHNLIELQLFVFGICHRMVTIQNERNSANVGKAMQLTPDGDVDGEV